jgi:hypothetical protein
MTASAQINLHHTLMATSMRLNPAAINAIPDMPHQMPLTSASMLATLRERLTRFNNLQPKEASAIQLNESEGRLYEYLEGVLLRSVASALERSRVMAVYDLRTVDDWEDVEEKAEAASAAAADNDSAPIITFGNPATATTLNVGDVQMTIENDLHESDWDSDDSDDDEDHFLIVDDDLIDGEEDTTDDDSEDGDDDFHSAEENSDVDWNVEAELENPLNSNPAAESARDAWKNRAVGTASTTEIDPDQMGIRRQQAFDFNVTEMAVDPGQDLLVLVSQR